MSLELRNKDKCCPDYDCQYAEWNKKTCQYCDGVCAKCKSYVFKHQCNNIDIVQVGTDEYKCITCKYVFLFV